MMPNIVNDLQLPGAETAEHVCEKVTDWIIEVGSLRWMSEHHSRLSVTGLNKKQKARLVAVFTFLFLAVDATWPATLHSCHHDTPAVMDPQILSQNELFSFFNWILSVTVLQNQVM